LPVSVLLIIAVPFQTKRNMSQEDQTEVVVVGAGPVGLLTALLLAEGGVAVKIIDQEQRTAAHSYACALHPHTLLLLDQLGLVKEVLAIGRRIDTITFCEGETRRAELKISELPAKYPFLVILPQSRLESLLENALNQRAGLTVNWKHRLSTLRSDHNGVVATVDKLSGSARGYIVPHWEVVVQKTLHTHAKFAVGADGHFSLVRRCLGIDYVRVGEPQLFEVYEFDTDMDLANEGRIVLGESTTDVLWPLPDGRCRWSFQAGNLEPHGLFPEKDRRAIRVSDPEVDERTKERVAQLVQTRAPWFTATLAGLHWISDVQFERRLARRFGDGRCWLVGDAAHQTSPLGMQSVNIGFREAGELAGSLKKILREGAPIDLLESYNQQRRGEWLQLLGLKGPPTTSDGTDDWVRRHSSQILPCVPASGEDLGKLMNQLQLGLP
jgi:2-polyprenyl-6-methoxyphenol hydroxylase-like FAD-dependent oxidoreductase